MIDICLAVQNKMSQWVVKRYGIVLLVILKFLSSCQLAMAIGNEDVVSFNMPLQTAMVRSFEIDWERNCFTKDGEPFRYISGTMHYFRVPSFYWEDRLQKMRAAGLNAIETYIAWQVHETQKGQFDFSGDNDVIRFLELAHKNGLLVILRPGPFIDAERDFGGFPFWLLKKKDIKLRASNDKDYLAAVESWYNVLLPKFKPLLYQNGGPIISVQIENEYGSYYACDKVYLNFLKTLIQKHLGNDVILFTVDTAFSEKEILCGGLDDIFKTVDFGATRDVNTAFDILRKVQPKGPLVNTEFYTGWLDHWGEPHQTRSTKLIASALDKILAQNASVNLYMFEGGTNFAFWNGAEVLKTGRYMPEPTSYDYDAPLTEAGDTTEKYFAIREVIAKYSPKPLPNLPKSVPKIAYGRVKMDKVVSLFDALNSLVPGGPKVSHLPESMEDIGNAYGYILYRTMITTKSQIESTLRFDAIRDRAIIFIDEIFQSIVDRNMKPETRISNGRRLDILVENQGRVNYKYGEFTNLNDPKGLLGNVYLNGDAVVNWEIFPLPLDNMRNVSKNELPRSIINLKVPNFFLGYFKSPQIGDTFLKTEKWQKGQAFINGFNLGRYWPTAGPQQTLYVPGGLLHKPPYENEIILFETDGCLCEKIEECYIDLVDQPIWSMTR